MASQRVKLSAWDLCTNTKLTDLNAINPKYTERLNDAGPFSFSLDLTDSVGAEQTAILLGLGDNPFKILFVDASGNIAFSGIVRTMAMSPTSALVDFTGTMITGYFTSLFAANSYTTSTTPSSLLSHAITDAQAVPGANIFLTPNMRLVNPPPPFTPAYQIGQRIKVSQILSDVTMGITAGYGGVDYSVTSTFQADGTPAHLFNIYAPRCGLDHTTSGLTIDLTRIIDWSRTIDNTATSNQVVVVGAGTGTTQPIATATYPSPIGGLGQPPLMQGLYQYNRVTSQAHLQSIANGAVQMFGTPVEVYTVTLATDYAPCALGEFGIGDDVRLTEPVSAYFPNGLDAFWRIVAYQVSYPTEGVATVQLTLNNPPVY